MIIHLHDIVVIGGWCKEFVEKTLQTLFAPSLTLLEAPKARLFRLDGAALLLLEFLEELLLFAPT